VGASTETAGEVAARSTIKRIECERIDQPEEDSGYFFNSYRSLAGTFPARETTFSSNS